MIDIVKELEENFPAIDLEEIKEIQPDLPDDIIKSIKLYNKALNDMQAGSEDIAIISGDGMPISEFYHPGITAIKSPAFDIGKTAASLLLNKINNPDLPNENIILPPCLMVRESC